MRALTISLNLHFYASYNAAPTQTVRGVAWHPTKIPTHATRPHFLTS